ncbi:MAG: tetratricopeptide repeat protein [Bdellovibrionaceae bacterium]|nr:tetratricopeptide repeat protein [Pseudobdellovibrionaceae bacterium]MBX3033188.1 tetratricopeptide repeat protein [Pseudobdellovibrionaceae bacterium]
MPQFSSDAVARFEEVLRKDPTSQVFAPLAEAYRSEQRLAEAARVASDGVQRHPEFAGGWVVYGKILKELNRPREAMEALNKAVHFAPGNLLALQLLGESHLEAKRPKEALRVFKRILFLNPQAEKARRIVEKLESLTADEYEEEIFAMTKLTPLQAPEPATVIARDGDPAPAAKDRGAAPGGALLRMLSLIDAFIVRNDLNRASQLLDETRQEFGEDNEIRQRQILLQRRRTSQLGLRTEAAEPLAPLSSREEQIRDRKIKALQLVLQRIEGLRDDLDAPLTS